MKAYVKDHKLFFHTGDPRVVENRQTPNHGGYLEHPKFILTHYTGGHNAESSAEWLCNPIAKASAALIIASDGAKVIQLADFNRVTWHAGVSTWDGLVGLNHYAIGIELDNPGRLVKQGVRWFSTALGKSFPFEDGIEMTHKNESKPCGWHTYSANQLETFLDVSLALVEAYPSIGDVIGHDDVAPTRKFDPGPAFPMEQMRTKLFGRIGDTAL